MGGMEEQQPVRISATAAAATTMLAQRSRGQREGWNEQKKKFWKFRKEKQQQQQNECSNAISSTEKHLSFLFLNNNNHTQQTCTHTHASTVMQSIFCEKSRPPHQTILSPPLSLSISLSFNNNFCVRMKVCGFASALDETKWYYHALWYCLTVFVLLKMRRKEEFAYSLSKCSSDGGIAFPLWRNDDADGDTHSTAASSIFRARAAPAKTNRIRL